MSAIWETRYERELNRRFGEWRRDYGLRFEVAREEISAPKTYSLLALSAMFLAGLMCGAGVTILVMR